MIALVLTDDELKLLRQMAERESIRMEHRHLTVMPMADREWVRFRLLRGLIEVKLKGGC